MLDTVHHKCCDLKALGSGCLQGSATEKYLAVAIHPLVADADNAAAILSSLSAAYTAAKPHVINDLKHPSAAAQLALQPSLFTGWEDDQQASGIWQEHKMYWAKQLHGACCTLDLPRSVTQGKAATGTAWCIPINIGWDAWQQARRLAANESTEPVVVLLAALQVTICERQCCTIHIHLLNPWSILVSKCNNCLLNFMNTNLKAFAAHRSWGSEGGKGVETTLWGRLLVHYSPPGLLNSARTE